MGSFLENVIVIKGDMILNFGVLRYKDEFVCYKVFDVIGDMVLVVYLILGCFEGMCLGYWVNNLFFYELFV